MSYFNSCPQCQSKQIFKTYHRGMHGWECKECYASGKGGQGSLDNTTVNICNWCKQPINLDGATLSNIITLHPHCFEALVDEAGADK